ncbi:growth inhibitor PemK [Sphingobacteriaceae bacterium]|nr:growth inhibitor PemK [Sphingobacteriaceae bacterium]
MRKDFLKGEIVNVDLGLPPTSIKGHEQAKLRPCVVIKSFSSMQLAVVLPVTGSSPPSHLYTYVLVPAGEAGLTKDSFVLCHQIRTVSFDRIQKSIGKLGTKDFLKIKAVLSDTLEL